jgi:endonuclease YncB( thermonuclease family)
VLSPYGRTLAYLDKADGWDYSVEAARAGAAHSYVYHNNPAAGADEIAAAEEDARMAGRGLGGATLLRPDGFGSERVTARTDDSGQR